MSSTKLQPWVAHGFDSSNPPRDSDIINESAVTGVALLRLPKQPIGTQMSSTKLLSRVTHGLHSANSPWNRKIITETAAMGDAWIQKHKATLVTQNHQRNWWHG
jgi:hypothetical protein